ncbi:integrase domain-containing protein [Salmonella enterica]|nr:DNA-binding protein [Salmonella enterica]EIL8297012.1 integrase domain-containing protein [Salmonella enterica]EIS5895269.1 integrase domain-containing protein [Salmonella enterica]
MAILEQEMKRLAQQAGGSHKTVHDRIKLAQRFCERQVLAKNVQIRRVEQLKARHIEGYVRERLAQGITKRSLQNEMATVRCILKQAGRDRLAQSERLNNRSLGLSGASRNGTKLAITPDHYRYALENARVKDPGMAAALERGDTRLTVVFGTKGGRPRETIILDAGAVRKALGNALSVAEDRHGRLIDKPDLKSAMKYWHSQASRLGLTGAYSPHSLRYAWAQDAIRHYLAQGFCEKEALAMTAMDLGHGDGRGRYVAQVYGRKDTD